MAAQYRAAAGRCQNRNSFEFRFSSIGLGADARPDLIQA
jgi:hypothetical protein